MIAILIKGFTGAGGRDWKPGAKIDAPPGILQLLANQGYVDPKVTADMPPIQGTAHSIDVSASSTLYAPNDVTSAEPPTTGQSVTIAPTSAAIDAAGGTSDIAVTLIPPQAYWTAKNASAAWFTFSPVIPQANDGTVTLNISANASGVAREATLEINEQVLAISQGA
jgi:hypothetical protein